MRPSGSVKQNFVYHSIDTISATLFPLIAFPYASRILLPDGIGQVQFFKSIINYVVMLSSLGIPMYGIREIAKVRDDTLAMARTTAELLTLNLILAMIGYAIIAFLCCCIGKVQADPDPADGHRLSVVFSGRRRLSLSHPAESAGQGGRVGFSFSFRQDERGPAGLWRLFGHRRRRKQCFELHRVAATGCLAVGKGS